MTTYIPQGELIVGYKRRKVEQKPSVNLIPNPEERILSIIGTPEGERILPCLSAQDVLRFRDRKKPSGKGRKFRMVNGKLKERK